jgi:hypothetical protein
LQCKIKALTTTLTSMELMIEHNASEILTIWAAKRRDQCYDFWNIFAEKNWRFLKYFRRKKLAIFEIFSPKNGDFYSKLYSHIR